VPYSAKDFQYGPVFVLRGPHKGRIGEFDNDASERDRLLAVVQFAPFGVARGGHLIPVSYLRSPNTKDLLQRYNDLWRSLTPYLSAPLEDQERIMALEEMSYVAALLNDRMFDAQFARPHDDAKIFLSHASADKEFVRALAVDLSELGHTPWLDDWEILGGESIPSRIASGITESSFAIVVLSGNAVQSQWVENEWQAKYWEEIKTREIGVIPVLLSDCEIPVLLRPKKYIDFRSDYTAGLESLARTLSGYLSRQAGGG
jgi:hypothetical protein